MRPFSAFVIILAASILFMLPLTGMIYDYRTDQRTDSFDVTTGDSTSTNVTLLKAVYDDDTNTISFLSSIAEAPTLAAYDASTHSANISSLTGNTTRTLQVSYDVDALTSEGTAIASLLDRVPAVYLLCIVAFPFAALAAIFTGRA